MEKGVASVDQWAEGSQLYFLTHLHSDHTKGLSSTWSNAPLFCSKLTAKLFPSKFPLFNLSLLCVLDLGVWHSLSFVSPSSGSLSTLQVLAIDAHHCPGAVMLLFRGEFGCLLYTGDFRWEVTSERAKLGRNMLVDALKDDDRVDVLYLDNTYCNPSFEFPPRHVAAQQVVDIIASHPHHDIIIGIDSLGKEELLLHISRMLNIKIWVWPERLQTMHLLGFHDIFTTKTSLTRVRAVPRYSFSIYTLEELNKMHPTIGIMPSGLPWVVRPSKGEDNLFGSFVTSRYRKGNSSADGSADGGTGPDKLNSSVRSVERFHEYMYSVPYSDHSCFSELQEFIKLVHPTTVKGIVSSSSCYVDPLYYFGRLCEASWSSQKLSSERETTAIGKREFNIQTNFYHENYNNIEASRTKKKARVSRVRALRRVQCGAKIENCSSDS